MVGKVYRLDCKCGCEGFYIGSTVKTLNERITAHRSRMKTRNHKLYQHMREVGPDMFSITLIEHVEFIEYLKMKEAEHYDILRPTLNVIRPYYTEEESKILKKEYFQEFYKGNEEFLAKKRKRNKETGAPLKYYYDHKEIILKKRKEYFHKHKATIKLKHKKYYEENKKKIAKSHKKYYEKNKKKEC